MRMPQMDSHIRNISAASGQATGQPPTLPPLQNEQQLEIEKQWITEMIQVWQDEEFLEQEVHMHLGVAAGQAYERARRQEDAAPGDTDLSNLLFTMLQDLQQFDYTETFTGAFDVANKIVELLMVNEGQEVCCQGADDTARLQRLGTARDRQQAAQQEGNT